jgi:hypothetical protein
VRWPPKGVAVADFSTRLAGNPGAGVTWRITFTIEGRQHSNSQTFVLRGIASDFFGAHRLARRAVKTAARTFRRFEA